MSDSAPNPAAATAGTGDGGLGPEPSKRWLVLVVALVAVVLAVSLGGPRAYEEIKRQRGIRMGRAAGELLAAGNLPGGVRLLQMALQFAPADPGVNRVAARHCARLGRADGLTHWGIVLASREATRADRLEASDLAVRLGRVDLSGPWLDAAFREKPHDLAVLRLMVRHLQRLGDRPRAVHVARGMLREFPAEPEVELELGVLLLGDLSPEVRGEGRRLLWDVAAGTSASRERAVATLGNSQELGRSELEALVHAIEARTPTNLSARLQVLDLRMRLDPAQKPVIVGKALSLARPDSAPFDIGCVVLWLNRHGAVGEALPLLPLEHCQTNMMLMGARLDALMALNRADEIERMVTAKSAPLEGPLLAAARGVLAARAGRKAEAESLFREALKGDGRSSPGLPFVAKQAELAGLPVVAIEAYQQLLEIPGATLDAARQILRLVKPLDDLTVARTTLRHLNSYMPGEELVAGERAWLEALFGDQNDWALATLGRLARARPDQPGWRFGWALATWRKGDAPAALGLIEQAGPEWGKLEPRWQVVYVVVLGANQQREAARRLARQIPSDRLRLQEKTLLTPWM